MLDLIDLYVPLSPVTRISVRSAIPSFNRLVDYTADHRIHVGNHVGEVFLLVCVVSVRRCGVWG